MIIAPSILSADFKNLKDQLKELEDSGAQWVHFDVMDGHFVKNITFGTDILRAVKESTSLYVDVHLVVSDPLYYADIFMDAGADGITFHLDAVQDMEKSLKLIRHIKERCVRPGVTLYPKEDIHNYLPYLDEAELILVMSIEPGFGGQPFREDAVSRIAWLDEIRSKHAYDFVIQVDGGINAETAKLCLDAGADIFVAGSYVFRNDIKAAVASLFNLNK